MELIFIVLAGILMGAFNFGFFCLGYYVHSKKPIEKQVIAGDAKQAIKDISKWVNYNGIKEVDEE